MLSGVECLIHTNNAMQPKVAMHARRGCDLVTTVDDSCIEDLRIVYIDVLRMQWNNSVHHEKQ